MSSSLSLFDLIPGKVLLDRYSLLRPHRESGMSATFEVEDQLDGGRREVQVFPAGLFESRDQGAEFSELLGKWAGIKSPVFPSVHAIHVLDDGSVLTVADFPSGQSVRSWLGDNPRMIVQDVRQMAISILEGLVDIHGLGLVHGDIKPQTLYFVSGENRVTIVDGGVTTGLWAAKHMGTRTALIGTPYYAPLEQFSGESPDISSDLYNLATVMYEMISGALPWAGKGFLEVFQSKMQKTPPRMADRAHGLDIDVGFEEVVLYGLSGERRNRYQSAEEFLTALETVELG